MAPNFMFLRPEAATSPMTQGGGGAETGAGAVETAASVEMEISAVEVEAAMGLETATAVSSTRPKVGSIGAPSADGVAAKASWISIKSPLTSVF
jgi:hypothetical protein